MNEHERDETDRQRGGQLGTQVEEKISKRGWEFQGSQVSAVN